MNKIFDKINEIIKNYDNVIIMGHRDPDLDSLGSSLGLYQIVESLEKCAYLFLNDKDLSNYNNNINESFNRMKKDIICVNSDSYKKIKGSTLLIITDVHIKERLEYPDIVDELDVIVLDHHIKSKSYIKDTKYMYIDSNLSSMCEFIAYYSNYMNIDLDNLIATILLAGIEIDTNGYNLKTTDKTYEAASILMKKGADAIVKQELLKETKEEYMKRASFIRNSFMINDNTAMCIINDTVSSMELSSTAEELLTFEDINSSFVLGRLEDGRIGVSARSLGDIDVSYIMKKMGGGGHSSNAACQVENKTIKEVKQEIINRINEK